MSLKHLGQTGFTACFPHELHIWFDWDAMDLLVPTHCPAKVTIWARPACSFRMPRLAHGLLPGKASMKSRKYHASHWKCLSTYTAKIKIVNPNHSWVWSRGHKSPKIEIAPSTVLSHCFPTSDKLTSPGWGVAELSELRLYSFLPHY